MTVSISNFDEFNTIELGFDEMQIIDGGERSTRTWLIEAGVFVLFGVVGVVAFEVGYSN